MPDTINGFQILRKVAESNTAEIFHVLQLLGRGRGGEFALKALREEYADDRIERGYLDNEFRICRDLDHPNLVRVYEAALDVERPYLLMELIHGRSLRDHLSRRFVSPRSALIVVGQAADGLGYFHAHGYIHRDIKPQNIVTGKDGVTRIIDFALACPTDRSLGRLLRRRLFERRRPGTWSYMAPEQIQNARLMPQTDIYCLGITLFEALAGRLPYNATTPQALLEMHLSSPLPSVKALNNEVPEGVDELLKAMTAKDPLDRPEKMDYVSAKCREFAKGLPKG